MLKFAVLSVLVCVSTAYDSHGYGDDGYGSHSVELPIKSYHDMKVIHSPSHIQKHKTQVVVKANDMPVYVTFNSQSSPVYVKQNHKGTKGSYHKTESKDEPHKLVHEVIKPVYQEIKEIIKPYRKVVQVIEPVREERLTKVHKSEGHHGEDYGKKYEGNGDEYKMAQKYDDNDSYKKSYEMSKKYDEEDEKYYGKKYDQDDDGYLKMEYRKNDDGDLYKGGSKNMYFQMDHNKKYDSRDSHRESYDSHRESYGSPKKFRGMLDGL